MPALGIRDPAFYDKGISGQDERMFEAIRRPCALNQIPLAADL